MSITMVWAKCFYCGFSASQAAENDSLSIEEAKKFLVKKHSLSGCKKGITPFIANFSNSGAIGK
jgi:hypothetical protein